MPQFTVNAQRFDPYLNFKFRLMWDGRYVAGISKVSALKRSTEIVEHRVGGDPSTSRKSPGRHKFEAITLERGVSLLWLDPTGAPRISYGWGLYAPQPRYLIPRATLHLADLLSREPSPCRAFACF